MKTDINELITLGYELEGLLLLALHRGDDTPREVWRMIDAHIKSLASGVSSELECDEPVVVDASDNGDVIPVCETDIATAVEADVCVMPDVAGTGVDEVAEEEETPDSPADSCEPVTPVDVPDLHDDVHDMSSDDDDDDDDDDADKDMTLDEKLARANSRCLRKAFSLNDRFRFRRELFGNSDAAITDTLDLVEAMRSIDEARDYFFGELEWDPENQEVKDFMEIVTKHFLGR